MRVLKLIKQISLEQINSEMKNAKTVTNYKRWLVIKLIVSGITNAGQIASITTFSKPNVYLIVKEFNDKNRDSISTSKRGGRLRSLMSLEDEINLLKSLEEKAFKGQILSYLDVKSIIETKINKKVSKDYVWDLFKRHNWSKHTPRPYHPKKDIKLQEDFKKNSKRKWQPVNPNLKKI